MLSRPPSSFLSRAFSHHMMVVMMWCVCVLFCSSGVVGRPVPPVVPSPTPAPSPSQYNIGQGSYVADSGVIYWTITPDDPFDTKRIYYNVTALTEGWAGIGFAYHPRMLGSDFIVFGASGSILDQYGSESNERPIVDTIQNFNVTSITYTEGWVNAIFFRDVDTGDVGEDLTIDQTEYILWALGEGDVDVANYLQHYHFGAAVWTDKSTGTFVTFKVDYNLQDDHAILMFTAWGFLAFLGITMTKLKTLGKSWFHAHVAFQILAMIISSVGFIVIIVKVSDNFDTHFLDTHQQIGLAVLVFSYFQPLLGLLSHVKYDSDRKKVPFWPDRVHHWLGYMVVMLCNVNIFVGLSEYGAERRLFIIAGVWLGLQIVMCWLIYYLEKFGSALIPLDTEKKILPPDISMMLYALCLIQVLGGLVSVAVFAAYIKAEDEENIILTYN